MYFLGTQLATTRHLGVPGGNISPTSGNIPRGDEDPQNRHGKPRNTLAAVTRFGIGPHIPLDPPGHIEVAP